MPREAIIVPGSSSWWLLTLTPVIYFDRVRVPAADIADVRRQESDSFYHWSVSKVLQALEKYGEEEEVLLLDPGIPGGGRGPVITREARRLANALLLQAANYNPWKPTVVRPSELKTVMTHAYREWIIYNKNKANALPPRDPLRKELAQKQIPRWQEVLARLRTSPSRQMPELLQKDPELNTVFTDVVRNAYLLTTTGGSAGQRAYDALAQEFLPAVKLLERYRVFCELPDRLPELLRLDLLVQVYDLRMERAARAASGRPVDPHSLTVAAFRERKRFALLRKRLSEIDSLLCEHSEKEAVLLREIIKLARDLHKQVQFIDFTGQAFLWAAGSYGLREILSLIDPGLPPIIAPLIANPWTTKPAREALKNLYLSAKGLGQGAGPAFSAMRDYVNTVTLTSSKGPRLFGSGVFRFWV
jgi:hypothetical protein